MPDPIERDPIDPFRPGLAAGVLLVGCLVVVGGITVVRGPVRWAGAVMLLIGLAAVASMARHLVRPVRAAPVDQQEQEPAASVPFTWTGLIVAVVVLFLFFLWRGLTDDNTKLSTATAMVVAAICVVVLLGPVLGIELYQRFTGRRR